ISTRQKRLDYRLLNDGSDEEASPEDRILESLPPPSCHDFVDTTDYEIFPSESPSQNATNSATPDSSSIISSSALSSRSRKRPAPATEWIWQDFDTTESVDREIRCIHIHEDTGSRCSWKTTDSARQTSTANMVSHLRKHSICAPGGIAEAYTQRKQPTIVDLFKGNENLTILELLEKNILRWIVTEKQAFTILD
ncbi:hypothetical protein V1517DRAFT_235222, partial [Lipomyces orientalis]